MKHPLQEADHNTQELASHLLSLKTPLPLPLERDGQVEDRKLLASLALGEESLQFNSGCLSDHMHMVRQRKCIAKSAQPAWQNQQVL